MDQRMGLSGARRLLGRLRGVMAGAGSAQGRLDQVVEIIAADMEAEVCSAYLMRAGDILELSATQGLFPESVHRTRLRVGEGLVGVIAATARPLALSDAQSHPDFAYRPETGEEVYHSLMGVPILREGRVSGVLVVQNREPRHYNDEEIEALQTVAMVLAELAASGDLVARDELHPTDGIATLPHRLEGIRLNAGLALGIAVLHEPGIVIRQVVADNPELELDRLNRATSEMHLAIDRLFAASDLGKGGEHNDILDTYRMFAEDRGWLGRIREAIASGLTAEASVQKVRDDTRARMKQITDPYIRERLADLEDLANRLQHHLSGDVGTVAPAALPDDVVLIARSMGPAELLDYDRTRLRALVLEEGTPTSHVAVVARALDIPVVGRVKDALETIQAGDLIIVDGDNAQIMIRPGEDVQQTIEQRLGERRTRRARYHALRDLPATTLDGVTVSLQMNAGLLIDLPELALTGADGIGLYRTELPFMVRHSFPSVEEQAALYRRVLDQAVGKPVVFRTLDIGGDKLLPYLPEMVEENPAMGWRAIRIALDRPAMLRQQLRALIAAADGRAISIMFPMVAEIAEFDAACGILALEKRRAVARGVPLPARLSVGAVLEVPALIWQLPLLCGRADFVSVGSNDLMQFLFAKDRGNARLADRYDVLSPPALACLADIVRVTGAAKVPLGLCGEMAGNTLEAMTLIGLGFRTLSMSPSSIGPVKAMVRSLKLGPLRHYLVAQSMQPDRSLREKLRGFALDHMVAL
ncbi:MAG: phosphotransferase system, enzyme PtsP [Aliidongia sp.]|jgi:phosphotransferase system enzyme I (PtsP)|nr:phosphotransferase system, enzyme PtsP [Aliidongia sp.]